MAKRKMAKKAIVKKSVVKKASPKKKAAEKKTSKAASVPVSPSTDKQWEAQNAADTLMRAAQIRSNPDLHGRATKIMKATRAALDKGIKGK